MLNYTPMSDIEIVGSTANYFIVRIIYVLLQPQNIKPS